MEVTIPEALYQLMKPSMRHAFDLREDQLSWKKYVTLDLRSVGRTVTAELREFVLAHADILGAKILLKDLDMWIAAENAPSRMKARKVPQFEPILTERLLVVPGHRVYQKHSGSLWLCSVVTKVDYIPEERERHPEYVELTLIYEKFGKREQQRIQFFRDDCIGMTADEAMARQGFYVESEDLRAQYLAEVKRYKALIPLIGHQFSPRGKGYNDAPGGSGWGAAGSIVFADVDRPERVVIDIFREKEERDQSDRYDTGRYFWHGAWTASARRAKDRKEGEDPEDDDPPDRDGTTRPRQGIPAEDLEDREPPIVEIPVHPFVVVFDLNRHLRLSVHATGLTEWEWDEHLADKLILPPEVKGLITILVQNKSGGFRDLVSGKTGGAIVLLTGPPGVGKTLTAEVFSEAQKRPLYSVQASQLGTNPEELEGALLLVLGRAARWGAILLLDEADVYVHVRGNSLQQNAIVGVFLRVLEYHSSVLFLTTNRPDLVDDAIASRCVARIDYEYPTPEDQQRIWEVLSKNSGIALDRKVAAAFVAAHPHTSGRDVKNLLKLAALMSESTRKPIDVTALEYVLKFKPTVAV